jgi:HSP20 family molecular chaperone IbpA
MTIQVIRVIRELTDKGSLPGSTNRRTLCSEVHLDNLPTWTPHTDILEDEENVVIRVELAGIERENIRLCLKDGKLYITGSRQERRQEMQTRYHQLEISYGDFAKVISIPESIEHNDIDAAFDNGILYVTISKKSHVIEIPIKSENITD